MTKLGKISYNLTDKLTKGLIKHKIIYFVLNYTWGLFLTIIGFIIALIMLISKHKPHIRNGVIYFLAPKINGGFSIGMVSVICNESYDNLLNHEIGHTYQNAIFGIFMPFLVSIPSVIRYWYFIIKKPNKSYDSIWFEKSATDIGRYLK